jgi:hypothetical protein
MSMVEFIGFTISFLSLIFLFFRNRTQPSQENLENREILNGIEDPIQDFLKEFEREKKKKMLPSQLRVMKEKKKIEKTSKPFVQSENPKIPPHALKKTLKKEEMINEGGEIQLMASENPRINKKLKELKNLKDLVIYREILDKPKGLRSWD